jgi:hypothetical protein
MCDSTRFVFVRCQDYLAIMRVPTILKQQQHWKIDFKVVWIAKKELNKL